ncbi:MAG: hypothetical protein HDT43_06380 [Ruminococcaceae bacterium]|nr:hypothetical protein [Oscillospiraceae bacterium]
MENIKDLSKAAEELYSGEVKTIFGMLNDILELYEASDCFNRIPGTDDGEDAWEYFEKRVGDVRKKLAADCRGKSLDEEYRKLERIIGETEDFIQSHSVPGVAERWKDINPRINYFDCVFEIIEKQGMEEAQLLNSMGMLAFLPSDDDIKARNDYFEQIKTANDRDDLQYSEERVFQDELLRTLAMVFENDFGSEDNSRGA